MFEYFPHNYVWNLAVCGVLNSGGHIDEVDRACSPLREAATRGADVGTEKFYDSWAMVADQVIALAQADEAAGRHRSARQKYSRAAVYLGAAERLQSYRWAPRKQVYQRVLDVFAQGTVESNCERVEVPFEGGTSLPGYLVSARGEDEPGPYIIQWNGLDSTKEMLYQTGFADELAVRGISTLIVDTPGTGEALRLRGMAATADTERWATACVDFLEKRPDADPKRIGLVGWSLGGYFAPRAACFEQRLALCVAWGANYDWGEMQKRRLEREGEVPVPHYWDHVRWVWGADDMESFMDTAQNVTLKGILHRMKIPFLVTHGVNDRQIPVEYAHRTYEDAVNSPKRDLRIFTEAEGAAEHVGVDNIALVSTYIADWIAETFDAQAQ